MRTRGTKWLAFNICVASLASACNGPGDPPTDHDSAGDARMAGDCGPPAPESDCTRVTEFPAGVDTVKCEGKKLVATWHFTGACPLSSDARIKKSYTCTYVCKNQCKIPFYGCVDPLHGKALVADICK